MGKQRGLGGQKENERVYGAESTEIAERAEVLSIHRSIHPILYPVIAINK